MPITNLVAQGKDFTIENLNNDLDELKAGVLIADLPAEVYHGGPGYGSGKLMCAATKSYQHMQVPVEQTDAMRFGSLVHTLVLEPEQYAKLYCVRPPDCDRRTKAGKANYEAWEAEKANRIEIKAAERDEAKAIADSVLAHPVAGRLLASAALKELSAYKEIDGVLCHARLDAYDQKSGVIYDLKTTPDARPDAFAKSLCMYALQAAMYTRLMYEISSYSVAHEFMIIAVEKTKPYGVRLYRVGPNTLQVGRDLLEQAIKAIKEGENNIYNIPYLAVPVTLEVPGWFITKNGDTLDELERITEAETW